MKPIKIINFYKVNNMLNIFDFKRKLNTESIKVETAKC